MKTIQFNSTLLVVVKECIVHLFPNDNTSKNAIIAMPSNGGNYPKNKILTIIGQILGMKHVLNRSLGWLHGLMTYVVIL